MSTKTPTSKTPKTTKAVAAAQAADAAANAKAVKPKATTVDADGGIMVDVVETTPAKTPKGQKTPKAPKEPKVKKISGLDAAAQVLKDKGEPMTCKDIVETMLAKGMWKTGGKTPHRHHLQRHAPRDRRQARRDPLRQNRSRPLRPGEDQGLKRRVAGPARPPGRAGSPR
jgi:hypothetical protein